MKITFNNGMEMEITEAPARQEPRYVIPGNHRDAYAALVSAPPPPPAGYSSAQFYDKYREWWNSSRAVALR